MGVYDGLNSYSCIVLGLSGLWTMRRGGVQQHKSGRVWRTDIWEAFSLLDEKRSGAGLGILFLFGVQGYCSQSVIIFFEGRAGLVVSYDLYTGWPLRFGADLVRTGFCSCCLGCVGSCSRSSFVTGG